MNDSIRERRKEILFYKNDLCDNLRKYGLKILFAIYINNLNFFLPDLTFLWTKKSEFFFNVDQMPNFFGTNSHI